MSVLVFLFDASLQRVKMNASQIRDSFHLRRLLASKWRFTSHRNDKCRAPSPLDFNANLALTIQWKWILIELVPRNSISSNDLVYSKASCLFAFQLDDVCFELNIHTGRHLNI